ncbi:cell wall metabolism sensor histidine kinase WalK [Microbacterium sp. SORGH_AS_0862]|uniref:sensor histidine kinase n=1 Tax=Microbacterium sp. SORGH_AS_0862 TaxID=3041789 RepID=UPI002790D756|nr:ATP-binding protein [Microbacterium sp. SORGH_AS_0862]MDQ1204512.1 signal transduction histidine kinase [Microbacterium sp. SORGH_AS_0862]
MPLFEMEASPKGRLRVFGRTQLPFALGAVLIAVVAALVDLSLLERWPMITGFALTAVATCAAVAVPWERLHPSAMISIAVLDLVTVALLRAELAPSVPAVTILSFFPLLWLAYGFRWYGMAVAVIGAAFITSFQFVYISRWPSSPVEWANVVTFPVLILGVAVIVYIAANQLRRNSRRLADAARAQAESLRDAKDAEAIALGILNTVTAGVAFYDADGRLNVANTIARRMTEIAGFRLDTPPYSGENAFTADRITRIPDDEQIIPRALRGETIEDHLEWIGPPDSQVAIIASSGRVHREDGVLLGTVVVAYDVTELADAIEVREQFLRTVSHELRNPITSITGFLDLIDDAVDPADTKVHGYIDIVTRKTNDLLDRVRDLLAANDGAKSPNWTNNDTASLVGEAVERARSLADRNDVIVQVTGPDSLPVFADGEQLTIAITELLTNAIKFGDESAVVAIRYGLVGHRVTIAVTNPGHGITPAEQRRVFDRFYRAPFARAQAIQGFGLGLTNVRAIVAAHGGHIHIDSVHGAHTTFTLDVPQHPYTVSQD